MGERRRASDIAAAAMGVAVHHLLWATIGLFLHISSTSSITSTLAFSSIRAAQHHHGAGLPSPWRSPRRQQTVQEQAVVVPPPLPPLQQVSFATLVSGLQSVRSHDDSEQESGTLLSTTLSSNATSTSTTSMSSSFDDDNADNDPHSFPEQQRTVKQRSFEDSPLNPSGGEHRLDRLYSFVDYYYVNSINQQYNTNNDNPQRALQQDSPLVMVRHAPGSLGGAAALIAGTTVGAGVLALPSATVEAGFVPSTTALVLAWLVMLTSGLLLAEVSLQQTLRTGQPGQGLLQQLLLWQQQQPQPSTTTTTTTTCDGSAVVLSSDADDVDLPAAFIPILSVAPLQLLPWLGILAYFFLHYAVMVAYMAQGGAILEKTPMMFPQYDFTATTLAVAIPGPIVFAAGTAWFLAWSSNVMVERINNALVAVVALSLTGIVTLGASQADWNQLVDPSRQHWEVLPTCAPILLLSLVYQNVVPTVVMQLEGSRRKIVQAIVLGTAVPLVMFVLWNAVVLGNTASSSSMTDGMDPVALLQLGSTTNEDGTSPDGGSSWLLSPLVTIFSMSALVTSVIGFTYGLLDAWTDILGVSTVNNPQAMEQWKLPLFALVFVPPVALSLANPDIFYTALDYGGAFGVSTLFLLLPPLLVWRQRRETLENKVDDDDGDYGMDAMAMTPLVPGGPVSLLALVSVGMGLLLQQGADKFGAGFLDAVVVP